MEIEYVWHTFNIAEAFASLVPFRSKRYVKKLDNVCPNDIYKIFIRHDGRQGLKATIILYSDIANTTTPSKIFTYGISMRDMWNNVLEELAKFKNMKNAEELCIWLDTKDI